MSLQDEIKAAIAAHGMWKVRLSSAIETGTSDFSVNIVQQDNQCAFGKWLYGTSLTAAQKGDAHYPKVRDLHKQFHQAASKVLAMALAGKKTEASAAMKSDSEFAKISSQLTRAMMDWVGSNAK